MSEPADLSAMLACGGRHLGWEPPNGTITLLAALAAHAGAGGTLPVAAIPRGIQLIAAGPVTFAAGLRACPIGHLAVHRISQL
jgi:hypothetical protein